MNTTDFYKKFTEFEVKNSLFDMTGVDGILIWDIVRYDIFMQLSNANVRKSNINVSNEHRSLKYLLLLIRLLCIDLLQLFKRRNIDYIFYIYPRKMNARGFIFDEISEGVISLVSECSFIIDKRMTNRTGRQAYNNVALKFLRRLYLLSKSSKSSYSNIALLIKNEFKSDCDFSARINFLVRTYQADYFYYRCLFRRLKPRAIFFINCTDEKGLCAAANSLNINTIELQHGQANKYHPAYSYPQEVDYSNLVTFPHAFFTFSDYWKDVNYPVKLKLTIGDSRFLGYKRTDNNNVCVILAKPYEDDLLPLVKELAIQNSFRRILVRLHPEQYDQFYQLKEYFADFDNVNVVSKDESIYKTFEKINSVVLIQSTVLYEALNVGLKVFIYQKQDYTSHHDIFTSKNVYLVNSSMEISNNLQNNFIVEDGYTFFSTFNINAVNDFLQTLPNKVVN